ncbi:hypothetical protein H5T51_08620 [Candidatus Bathyarchaeota archaeon]|nr:hypothetical protein [Candidatus Bathyarchaeota archaeon]
MINPIKRALTRRVIRRTTRGHIQVIEEPPSRSLLYTVYFSLGMVACLTILEATHLIMLKTWNTEIFTAISGLIGNITGVFSARLA